MLSHGLNRCGSVPSAILQPTFGARRTQAADRDRRGRSAYVELYPRRHRRRPDRRNPHHHGGASARISGEAGSVSAQLPITPAAASGRPPEPQCRADPVSTASVQKVQEICSTGSGSGLSPLEATRPPACGGVLAQSAQGSSTRAEAATMELTKPQGRRRRTGRSQRRCRCGSWRWTCSNSSPAALKPSVASEC